MRRFFDYNFDRLETGLNGDFFTSIFSSSLAAFSLPDAIAAPPMDFPLFANIDGDSGDNTLNGTADADVINGFAGNDILNGFAGDDTLNGGVGNDVIDGGAGADVLDGGEGSDRLNYLNSSEAIQLDFTTNTHTGGEAEGDSITGFEILTASNFDDTIKLDGSGWEVFAESGNDVVFGGSEEDTVNLGQGDDTFSLLSLFDSTGDNVDGGEGIDTLFFDVEDGSFNGSVVYDLQLGHRSFNGNVTNIFANFEHYDGSGLGSGSRENVFGTDGDNIIRTSGGNNILEGRGGNDTINGGAGTDSAQYSGVQANYTVTDNMDGTYTVTDDVGSDGTDTLENIEFLIFADVTLDIAAAVGGSMDGEVIDGTSGEDVLNGTAGDDIINGFAGDDIINGLAGHDTLNGGDGDDLINGGEGADTIDGGAGIDTLSFENETEAVNIFYSSSSDVTNVNTQTGIDNFTNIERIIGGSGDDRFITLDANSTEVFHFDGGAGDDYFRGSAGDDVFIGGEGDDFVIGRRGNDFFDGGSGSDRYSTFSLGQVFNPTNAYVADLALGEISDNGFGETITLINVEGISGGTFFADIFNGDDNDNDIFGNLGGADTVNGFGGNDFLSLASGTGTVDGGTGIDEFFFTDSIYDTVLQDFQPYFQGSQIDLTSGMLTDGFGHSGGTISNVENIRDTNLSDVLMGNAQHNIIMLGRGADIANGAEGIDTVSFLNTPSVTANLATGFASQSVDALEVSTAAPLESSFLTAALNDTLTIRFFTTEAQSGIMRGFFRGIESDTTDSAGVRTIIFNPFGLDDTQLEQRQFTSAAGEAFVTMIVDAMGNLTYTATVSYENIDPATITAITFRYGDTIDTIHFMMPDGILGQADIIDQISNFENIIGSHEDDFLVGDSDNNEITGEHGDDFIDGGLGADIAIYSGVEANYTVTDNLDGTFTIEDNVGMDGLDTLTNVEFVEFADGVVDLSTLIGPINGTPGNDNITGTVDADIINGLAGNDILDGLAGDDEINGGDGADRLIGGEGADILNGGAGFDSADYRGAASGVRFNVDTGGTLGEALGDSFSGLERYYLSNFNDVITGSSANEFFFGGDGNDQINGGGGIDRIYGGDGNDIQRGQDGNDTLYGSAGNDQLNGGAGFDIANYSLAAAGVIVNMLTGGTGGDAAGDSYFGIEAVYGTDFDDGIFGNNSANELRGGDGNDNLEGGGGNDRLFGGAGEDMLFGGTGIDIAVYTDAASGVGVNLEGAGTFGDALNDIYSEIEWVFGSDFNDTISGDAASNRLEGRDGNDTLNGAGGNDRLLGGDGNDIINGGDGVDTIFGQDGDDLMSGGAGNDFFFGGAGSDSHNGDAGFDTVSYLASSSGVTLSLDAVGTGGDAAGDDYQSIERVFGSSHNDSITGSANDDVLLGNGGNDYLAGDSGNDSLNGGAGIDTFGYVTFGDDADVIQGFALNEVIYILGGDANFDTWAEVQAVGSDAGANVIFDFGGGNTLTIVGRNLADLGASNFDFSGIPPAAEPLGDPDAFAADIDDVYDMDALI